MIQLSLNQTELRILLICLMHLQETLNRSEQRSKAENVKLSKLVAEIMGEINENPDMPYDSKVTISSEAFSDIENSLMMMMTDAQMAKMYSPFADSIVNGVPISKLADAVPLMRDMVRSLETSSKFRGLENRIEELEMKLNRSNIR